jgi:hypothetical protein
VTRTIGNIRVGEADVTQDKASHTRGVRQGNRPGSRPAEGVDPGMPGGGGKGTARRSTGINAEARNPIDTRMPNLSPA